MAKLRTGNTAARTYKWIEVVAQKLAFEFVSISQSLDSLIVTVRRSGDWITVMREIVPPAVNVSRIGDLERLAKTVEAGSAPHDIANKLAKLESEPPAYSAWLIAVAVGVASGGFAFINGAAAGDALKLAATPDR